MHPDDTQRRPSVFVVEDEALVALNLEMVLGDIGYDVIGPAMRFDHAQGMIEQGLSADAAILDVNIGGRKVFELAEKLASREIPIVFATGYGKAGVPEEWRGCPVLQKPYVEQDVRSALATLLSEG